MKRKQLHHTLRLNSRFARMIRRHRTKAVGVGILLASLLFIAGGSAFFFKSTPSSYGSDVPVIEPIAIDESSQDEKETASDTKPAQKPTASSDVPSGSSGASPAAKTCTKVVPKPVTAAAADTTKPGLTTNTTYQYYEVYGYTANAVRAQLNSCHYQDYDAYAYRSISWAYLYDHLSPTACGIKNAAVQLEITYIMPKWQSTTYAEAGLASRWNTFITNLTIHEQGHGSLYVKHSNKIVSRLNSIGTRTDCAAVGEAANAAANAEIASMNTANEQYDDTTGHGATQGAIFP